LTITADIIARGKSHTICAIVENGKSRLKEYLMGLERDVADAAVAMIDFIAENGRPRNKDKFGTEGGGIYAIKNKSLGVRMLCFFDREKIILITHGFKKDFQKGIKLDREVEKARRIKRMYFEQKGGTK
jgi:phage-related protein